VFTMKNVVFWDVEPCGSCRNRRFGGTYRLHRQGEEIIILVTANVVPSSLILFVVVYCYIIIRFEAR
jgi:hypothetical protein